MLHGSESEFHYQRYGRRTTRHWAVEGIIPNLERRYLETESHHMRERIGQLMAMHPCPVCHGAR